MKALLFLILIVAPLAAQNEMWNLPLSQQDTTIIFTVNANRIDSLVHVTANGRHIVQAVYNAEEIAARLRLAVLSVTITPFEVNREVERRRAEVAQELSRLDADTMTAADYRQAARSIRDKKRQYIRTSKKTAQVTE